MSFLRGNVAAEYIKHLYSDDLEGYIQVMQLRNNQALKIFNTDIKGVVDIVQEQQGQEDTFITPNSFYIPERSNANIRHFRALYIDLDLKNHGKQEAFYEIYLKAAKGDIPKPSMIVDSGRGLHCYWRIEHAPKQAVYTWQELQDYLYSQLKPLGADLRATDAARVLRLPSTINSKNNAICEVLEVNDFKYSMYELRKKYLNFKKKDKPSTNPKGKGKVKHFFNSYTLHLARAKDIETLIRLRDYNITGYRNSFLHCYVYWTGIYTRDHNELLGIAETLNNSLREPLNANEVKAIVRSTDKAIAKFIEYEQGLRSGQVKRVSKRMRDKGGYWYTNETLIEMLDITEQEQRHLKTIVGKQEKYRRNNERRRQERRNEQGLTLREQQKQDTMKAINELREQGLTLQEIANKLNITIDGVKYHLYR